ncbi:hypothetical protein [Propionicimonas sp.]|uniref:hypothetical protein n=1 Tax=Propionicimonas sp. TaxID=1955623 RepID=UPI001795C41E|nr:hypothetical protein [Propionicimonas sp.]MBU3975925.1 hypothetical protein [Actinomycetota bacterium]MBA3020741.1 hypothetical protein [Propionicimonas sp.]MBU3985115.1 hypothetical protein [Actinomycetota bacterium]MBU4008105.1 hypothetical protein [Actinomycetota bacterium]MBU4064681.1 hypothetical protein [Actinomycetota bacterium]
MGWFTTRRDWSTGAIEPHDSWIRHAHPYPDTLAVVREAIRESGADAALVDLPGAVVAVWRMIAGIAKDNLKDRRAIEDLDKVLHREDLDDQKIWDFLTHQEALGVAIRNNLIEDYFQTGMITQALVGMIRDGSLKISLGGQARVGAGDAGPGIGGGDRI